jgi:hypothetical protein
MSDETKKKAIIVVDAKANTLKGAAATTRLSVQPGQTLSIWVDEDEAWELSAGRSFGANGNAKRTIEHPTNNQFQYSNGGLVGSLDGKAFFPIGSWLHMGVPQKGELSLYNWDDGPDDNKGEIEVVIGVQDYKDDETLVGRARAASWARFLVKADEHFSSGGKGLDTGLDVRPGDILRVVVSGDDVWTTSTGAILCRANGYGFSEGQPDLVEMGKPVAFSFPKGALIGSLDNGKTYFFVGNHLELTALGAGRLTLYCADTTLSDNAPGLAESKRSITAYVDVVKSGAYRGLLSR